MGEGRCWAGLGWQVWAVGNQAGTCRLNTCALSLTFFLGVAAFPLRLISVLTLWPLKQIPTNEQLVVLQQQVSFGVESLPSSSPLHPPIASFHPAPLFIADTS